MIIRLRLKEVQIRHTKKANENHSKQKKSMTALTLVNTFCLQNLYNQLKKKKNLLKDSFFIRLLYQICINSNLPSEKGKKRTLVKKVLKI